MLYRRKPTTPPVDAMQWTGDNIQAIWDWCGCTGIYGPTERNPHTLLLTTIDGVQAPCPLGHWVIAEPKHGRFYPCHPDVFAAAYEPDNGANS